MSKEELIQSIVENLAKCQRPAKLSGWQQNGLSHSQVGMLFMLYYHKRLQIKQISEYLGVTKSAASQMIDPLVKKGLVSRQVDPTDRRIAYLSLTAKGTVIIKKLHKEKFAGLRSRLSTLSASELDMLVALCLKMAAAQL